MTVCHWFRGTTEKLLDSGGVVLLLWEKKDAEVKREKTQILNITPSR